MDASAFPWLTSLAFVVVGCAIVAADRPAREQRLLFGTLVSAVGIGSVIQHGPAPGWADLPHDLPIVAVLAYVASDAAVHLTGRRLSAAWWVVPTLALVPIIVVVPRPADAVQALLAGIAVGLSLVRALRHPATRSPIVAAAAVLVLGAVVGTLTRPGWPLDAGTDLGHSVWHVLAAVALWLVAPVFGVRRA